MVNQWLFKIKKDESQICLAINREGILMLVGYKVFKLIRV